ncbi:MAG: hypothetical protein U9N55_07465 [candidate division Zixibacteria bacterium]|nr:hypothetical protein [candidate division Zixibacteria bacterium]
MLLLKRLTIILIILAVCAPNVLSRRRKPKSGKIEDSVYTDSKYNFQLTLLDGWNVSLNKLDENCRFIMLKDKYQIPSIYANAPDYTLIPRLTVYVAEIPVTPFEMLDSLLSETYSSDEKDDLLKELEILNNQFIGEAEREDVVTRVRRLYNIGDFKGVLWQGKSNYMKKVVQSSSTGSGKRVYGAYQGVVVIMRIDKGKLLFFHLISEDQYFTMNWKDAKQLIDSFKIPGEEKDTSSKSKDD